ncbi:MAG TPA: hypothetical protein PL053_09445 [Deltaproteobacteria bacterium]|nr:hypothetical protein [Deltaproteobacteria bacterium]
MSIKKLNAGDIIEARCTRCRAVLNHCIVAMVGDKVVRVECNTCGGIHNYYPPPSAKSEKTSKSASTTSAGKSSAPRAPKKDAAAAEREEWVAQVSGRESSAALAYSMTSRYKKGELVRHPVFGLGIVKQIIVPNKMQVLFQDGCKLLRCL